MKSHAFYLTFTLLFGTIVCTPVGTANKICDSNPRLNERRDQVSTFFRDPDVGAAYITTINAKTTTTNACIICFASVKPEDKFKCDCSVICHRQCMLRWSRTRQYDGKDPSCPQCIQEPKAGIVPFAVTYPIREALLKAIPEEDSMVAEQIHKQNLVLGRAEIDLLVLAANKNLRLTAQELILAGIPILAEAVMVAVHHDSLEVYETLLNHCQSSYNTQFLNSAVLWRASRILEYMVVNGGQVNAISDRLYYRTPLLQAAKTGDVNAVNLLMRHGADISVVDYFGDSALHLAIDGKNNVLAEIFANWNAESLTMIDSRNKFGLTPLLVASQKISLESMRLLLNNGAYVNATTDVSGSNILHLAVRYARRWNYKLQDLDTLLSWLSQEQLNNLMQQRNAKNQTPMMKAHGFGRRAVRNVLKAHYHGH